MKRHAKGDSCCATPALDGCKVESLVTVDDRGRWSSPRICAIGRGSGWRQAGVDRLGKAGKVCCLSLIKVEELSTMVKGVLGPLMGNLLPKG